MERHSNINSANSDVSQEWDIHEVFKSHGYGVWIPLPRFPHLHEFNRAIHNLRYRDDLNIQNRCERTVRADGRKGTDSFYRLLPGSWRELRGKPESKKDAGNSRHNRALEFERQFRPAHPWKNAFSEKRMAQDDCFVLTPPEPRQ